MVYEQFDSQAASLVGISTSVATRRLNIYSERFTVNSLMAGTMYVLAAANNPTEGILALLPDIQPKS